MYSCELIFGVETASNYTTLFTRRRVVCGPFHFPAYNKPAEADRVVVAIIVEYLALFLHALSPDQRVIWSGFHESADSFGNNRSADIKHIFYSFILYTNSSLLCDKFVLICLVLVNCSGWLNMYYIRLDLCFINSFYFNKLSFKHHIRSCIDAILVRYNYCFYSTYTNTHLQPSNTPYSLTQK